MLQDIEAVIFDLDGTLTDSMWVWKQVDIDYMKMLGKEATAEYSDEIEGMSMRETAVYTKETLELEDSVESIMATWNEMARQAYLHEVKFKPGVLDFLQYLRANGYKTGIATSNSKELLEAVTKNLSLDTYIDCFLTGDEVHKGKPNPDVYLEVAKRISVEPSHCLVFEDVPAGIEAGKAAGMRVCAVDDEFSRRLNDIKKQKADYFVMTMDEAIPRQNK